MLTMPSKPTQTFFQVLSSYLVDRTVQNHKNLKITFRFIGANALRTFQLAKNIE
jgi:hypothetical protein